MAKNPNVGGTAGKLVPYELAKHADLYGLSFLPLIAVQHPCNDDMLAYLNCYYYIRRISMQDLKELNGWRISHAYLLLRLSRKF